LSCGRSEPNLFFFSLMGSQVLISLRGTRVPQYFNLLSNNCFNCPQVLWTLRWEFPLAQAQYTEHRVPDNRPLRELLASFVAVGPDTVVRRQRLKPYLKPGSDALDHLRITVAAERCAPGEEKRHECPLDSSLRDAFKGVTLIEFPVLTVELL
jgi:hypothetical protein